MLRGGPLSLRRVAITTHYSCGMNSVVTNDEVQASGGQRRPGRPRNDGVDAVILAAAVDLLVETDDPEDITITAIIARAGSSRAALYRRWDSRDSLLAAALDAVRDPVDFHHTGDAVSDVLSFFADQIHEGDRFQNLLVKRQMLMASSPRLRRIYYDEFITARRRVLRGGFASLQADGILSAHADLSALVDLVYGVQYMHHMVIPGGTGLTDRMRASIEAALRPYLTER